MASGRKLIINWLIKSKAIKDDERELYEYALYSIVLLLSPAFISIAICQACMYMFCGFINISYSVFMDFD